MKARGLLASAAIMGVALLAGHAALTEGTGVKACAQAGSGADLIGSTDGVFRIVESLTGETYLVDSDRTGAKNPAPPFVVNGDGACSTVPTLLAPPDGATLETLWPLFRVDMGSDSAATKCVLQVARDQGFEEIVTTVWPARTQGIWEMRLWWNLEAASTYYWRARLECDETPGPYTSVWSFTTGSGGTIPSAPQLVAPLNGSSPDSWPVTLQWSPVAGVIDYIVSWKEPGSNTTYLRVVTDTHSLLPRWNLEPDTTYEWWVVGRSDYAIGTPSAHWRFTTPGQPTATPTPSVTPSPTLTSRPTMTDTPTATATATATSTLMYVYLPVIARNYEQ